MGQPTYLDFRGYAGTIASGKIGVGDDVLVANSGRQSKVASLYVADRLSETAEAGDAVTITLADELDIARGTCCARRRRGRRSPTSSPRM